MKVFRGKNIEGEPTPVAHIRVSDFVIEIDVSKIFPLKVEHMAAEIKARFMNDGRNIDDPKVEAALTETDVVEMVKEIMANPSSELGMYANLDEVDEEVFRDTDPDNDKPI